jgi:hypothetical protein
MTLFYFDSTCRYAHSFYLSHLYVATLLVDVYQPMIFRYRFNN